MGNKGSRHVIFSFDYELYLGAKSGSVNKCLLEPTAELLKILQLYSAKAVFFIDTAWLVKLKEVSREYDSARTDFDNVVGQMRNMAKAGHYLFPHLHPHWLDACYMLNINQWELKDITKYHFHALNNEQREMVFAKGISLLKEIVLPVLPDYSPCGYRAGGWSIEPFCDFEPFFRKYGIKYEFSKIGNDLPYAFTENMAKNDKGEFIEFPISKVHIPALLMLYNRLPAKLLWIKGDRGAGDGVGAATGKSQGDKMQNSGSADSKYTEMVAIELLTRAKMPAYIKFLKNNSYMQFIAHPKMVSRHNLKMFKSFMDIAFRRYEVETDFMKMMPHRLSE